MSVGEGTPSVRLSVSLVHALKRSSTLEEAVKYHEDGISWPIDAS